MKRSSALTFVLVGAGAVILSGCDDPQDVAVFESVEQCAQHADFTAEYCAIHMERAQAEHVRVAPKYTSIADCESDFGAGECEIAPQKTVGGGSVFMPLMMGYMMGHMLGGGSRVATQPLYRSRDDAGTFRTGDNRKMATRTGVSKVASRFTGPANTKTRTVRRGGFGTTAASRFASMQKSRSFRGFRRFGGFGG